MTVNYETLTADHLTETALSPDDLRIAAEIFRPNGGIYQSRPKKASGEAQYVWRHVVFSLSTNPKHHCIPVTDDFYMGQDYWDLPYDEKRQVLKLLDAIVDAITKLVPVTQQPGTIRWGRAFGII